MLRQAVHAIAALGTIEAVSPVYATAPIGFAAQPDFWNVVVRIRTRLNPVALLDAVKAVEVRLGRTPRFRDGPREIDIDVLQYDDVIRSEAPVVPHPRMHQRAFVLRPLTDLDPDLRDPRDGSRWADRLSKVKEQAIERVADGASLLPDDDG
ncbi:MAG: 2-amino-4-hydroxy-6-hydroxymethyldihydropteridine diphosphokinase [Candidatus Cloacimonetes bacterium]|jgi:2-amino-4-hydroxy-6-hydroxymethyldihydropteridine diphosphokinase|nr:2-amino-4-hydroxy-6-hydroxymethyldihydropteridine diphosphokinase [Candidatus Cloacimonadota bacterium]